MVFTVVSTLRTQGKNIVKEFSAVPSTWVNGNQVLWPQNEKLPTFIKDQNSVPQPSWSSHVCCIHRKNIKSFQEAVMWEAKYAEIDSDSEEDSKDSIIKISTPPEPMIQSYKSYEDLFKTDESNSENNDDESIKVEMLSVEDVDEEVEESHCRCQKITHDAILEMKAELVAIRKLLEEQQNDLAIALPSTVIKDEKFSSKFNFPIDSPDMLRALDSSLGDSNEYRQYLVDRFGRIFGTGGNVKGSNRIAVKLVSDLLFTKAVLAEFSWTGKSRSEVERKLPFRIFTNVVRLVDEILNNCDSRWHILDTENLFREKLLKHAKKRNTAEMERRERFLRIKTTTRTMKVTTTNSGGNNDNDTQSSSSKKKCYNL